MTHDRAFARAFPSRNVRFGCTLKRMAAEQRNRLRDEYHTLERRDTERRYETLAQSAESFDRMRFAMTLVGLFHPKNITVVFHESYTGVRVERGRDYARGGTWAMVGISQTASRERIALAVAEVLGMERVPFVVDLLVQAGRAAIEAPGADAPGFPL